MKKLTQYLKFDFQQFVSAGEKEFTIQSVKFNEEKGYITLNVVITKDTTGENLFEKFYVHLIQDNQPEMVSKYPIQSKIVFESAAATVWGEYNSQLSVRAVVRVVK